MINGLDSTYEFRISAEMLYFTNLVIRHYEFARNRGLREKFKGHQSNEYSDFYISPRTQAKALDLLRALAFLDGRTLGLPEETHLFDKSFTAVFNSLNAGNGFEQIRTLIAYESLLEQIEKDPFILQQPLDKTLSNSQLRRSLLDWIKDALQIDHTVQQNKKVLESFLKNLIPVCDEVRELKNSLEKETTKIFQQIEN